jgi:hypothetical protein
MRASKEKESKLTQAMLKDRLSYDPETGDFYWKPGKCLIAPESKAGTVKNGYIAISISRANFFAHRLAWLYMTGDWPEEYVDHINGNGLDNRWINLRAATRSQNQHNGPLRANNKSGYKNVCWDKRNRKWVVKVCKDKKVYEGGLFTDLEKAALAAEALRNQLHGDFVRHS